MEKKIIVALTIVGIILSNLSLMSANIIKKSNNSAIDNDINNGCHCSDYSCGCCEYFAILRGSICSNFSYLAQDYGISLTITYNNHTLFNETISARNPPPFCMGIPELDKISAEICLQLYDLNFANNKFHGCAKLKIFVFHLFHKKVDFGCFNIPSSIKAIMNHADFTAYKNYPEVKII